MSAETLKFVLKETEKEQSEGRLSDSQNSTGRKQTDRTQLQQTCSLYKKKEG